jgi:hypothetical protein
MAYASASGVGYGAARDKANGSVIHADSRIVIHKDAADANAIGIPDATLLKGHFARSGLDLILTDQDGRHHVITGYFASEHHAALRAPSGATLAGSVVDLLAASPAHVQYAQAQPSSPADSIGKVEKVVGNVTVMRNGVAVALHVGDAVHKSDVIETGANSSCGISFPDGTALNLVANTRMAMNEYSFDPNGTTNGALFTLVTGTFAFVAGKVAKTGGVNVATPVATMGIRGTAGMVKEIDLATIRFLVLEGHYSIADLLGRFLQEAEDSRYQYDITLPGPGQTPVVNVQLLRESDLQIERRLIDELSRYITNPNPSHPSPGSPGNPLNFPQLLQFFQQNGNGVPFNFASFGGNSYAPNSPPPIVFKPLPNPPPISPPAPGPTSHIVVWTAQTSGPWNTGPNWNVNAVPGASDDVRIFQRGELPLIVTIAQRELVHDLTIGEGVTLKILSPGSLTIFGALDDSGLILVNSTGEDPTLTFRGPVTVEPAGAIEARGSDAAIYFTNVLLLNEGAIEATQGGTIVMHGLKNGSANYGLIEADGGEIDINVDGDKNPGGAKIHAGNSSQGGNFGLIEAVNHGTIYIGNAASLLANHGTIAAVSGGTIVITGATTNASEATIEAAGWDSSITFLGNSLDNSGSIIATYGGAIAISGPVTNQGEATIEAVGWDSSVTFLGNSLDNSGAIVACQNGNILFLAETVTNESGAAITAKDGGAVIFATGTVTNDGGTIAAMDGGALAFQGAVFVHNGADGTIEASDYGTILFDGGEGDDGASGENDGGTIEARDHGTITFDNIGFTNTGLIEATDRGTITITGEPDGPAILNNGGTIAAIGCGATVAIVDNGSVDGGTLEADGGTLFVSSDSTITGTVNVVITDGGLADFANVLNANATVTVTFSGSGTFALEQPLSTCESTSRVAVSGFGVGDTIDLKNLAYSSDESLTVTTGSIVVLYVDGDPAESFTFEGSYAPSDFVLVSDPWGGTDIVYGAANYWIDGAGNWNNGEDWSGGVPDAQSTAEILTASGAVVVNDIEEVGNLVIGNYGALDIVDGGALHVLNALNDSGVITVDSTDCDPSLEVDGPVRIEDTGEIVARGDEASIAFNHDQVGNAGLITAQYGASVSFECAAVWNEACATIEARDGGTVSFDHASVTNEAGGLIKATGCGAEVNFSWSTVSNNGTIAAKFGGTIELSHTTVTQGCDGTIAAIGDATVDLDHATIVGGTLATSCGGLIQTIAGTSTLDGVSVINDGTISVDAMAPGSIVVLTLQDGTTITDGTLTVGDQGILDINGACGATLDGVAVDVSALGIIDVGAMTASGSILTLGDGTAITGGALTIQSHSQLDIEACTGATLDGVIVTNDGTIQVGEAASATTLILGNGTTIAGGALSIGNAGTLDIGSGGASLTGVTIINNGTIHVDGGEFALDSTSIISGAGDVVITDGGLANFAAAFEQNVTFSGAGILELQQSLSGGGYQGTLFGFGAGDGIVLADLAYSPTENFTWNGIDNTLTISNGAQSEILQFSGAYAQDNFMLINDGSGGSEIVFTTSTTEDFWTNASGDGQWSTAANWSDGVPTSTSNVVIGLPGTYSVTVSGAVTANSLTIADPGATLSGFGTLSIASIENDGTIDASVADATLALMGNVTGSGNLHIENKATLELAGTCTNVVTFEAGQGILQIDSSGTSSPFFLTGGALQLKDDVYLPNISFDAAADSYDAATGVLTVGDGTGNTVTINVIGGVSPGHTFSFSQFGTGTLIQDPVEPVGASGTVTFADVDASDTPTASVTPDRPGYFGDFSIDQPHVSAGKVSVDFKFSLDGDQIHLAPGETLTQSYDVSVADPLHPAASVHQTVSVSIGGPGDDTFVFHPGVGNDTIIDFDPQADTIELDHFAGLQSPDQLAAHITSDAQGDAVIALGHGDSITLPGVTASTLQAHLHNVVHLH